jgi:hypothetical protein
MDLDCTPPDESLCADVEDQPPYPDGYTIYHYYPCKLAYIDNKFYLPFCISLEFQNILKRKYYSVFLH